MGVELRVINIEGSGDGTIITVAIESEDVVAVGETAVLLDERRVPLAGGEMTVIKVKSRVARARSGLSMTVVRESGLKVRLTAATPR